MLDARCGKVGRMYTAADDKKAGTGEGGRGVVDRGGCYVPYPNLQYMSGWAACNNVKISAPTRMVTTLCEAEGRKNQLREPQREGEALCRRKVQTSSPVQKGN